MRISAVTNTFNYQRSQNFGGVLQYKKSGSEYYSYHGSGSSYNKDGNYQGYYDSSDYVYHPFEDESKAEIDEVLRKNNYCHYYDPDMTGGYDGSDSKTTELGRTIPYTEKEWKKLPQREKDNILKLL